MPDGSDREHARRVAARLNFRPPVASLTARTAPVNCADTRSRRAAVSCAVRAEQAPALPFGHVAGPARKIAVHTIVIGGMPGWQIALIAVLVIGTGRQGPLRHLLAMPRETRFVGFAICG